MIKVYINKLDSIYLTLCASNNYFLYILSSICPWNIKGMVSKMYSETEQSVLSVRAHPFHKDKINVAIKKIRLMSTMF